MIRWFTKNGIAANFLMIAILIAGSYAAVNHVPLEVTPALSWDTVMIEMPYRGGTAKDVERAILLPVEAALEAMRLGGAYGRSAVRPSPPPAGRERMHRGYL